MYPYEDRLRAVQLYIKLGKRIGLTIRQLGYPTKNALKTWYRKFEQRHELRSGYTRPAKFSQAQKERAVEHYLEHGKRIAAIRSAPNEVSQMKVDHQMTYRAAGLPGSLPAQSDG